MDAQSYTEWLEKLENGEYSLLSKAVDQLLQKGKDLPVIHRNRIVQARYIAHILDGHSHNWAEMCALMAPPQARTDREFLRGHCNGNQFEKTPMVGDLYKRRAESAGVDVKGKVYLGSLARYPGDPEAWVDGAADARRICEDRGWECNGFVNVKARQPLDDPVYPSVADDIIEDRVLDHLERMEDQEPGSSRSVDVVELGESIKESIKPHWAK